MIRKFYKECFYLKQILFLNNHIFTVHIKLRIYQSDTDNRNKNGLPKWVRERESMYMWVRERKSERKWASERETEKEQAFMWIKEIMGSEWEKDCWICTCTIFPFSLYLSFSKSLCFISMYTNPLPCPHSQTFCLLYTSASASLYLSLIISYLLIINLHLPITYLLLFTVFISLSLFSLTHTHTLSLLSLSLHSLSILSLSLILSLCNILSIFRLVWCRMDTSFMVHHITNIVFKSRVSNLKPWMTRLHFRRIFCNQISFIMCRCEPLMHICMCMYNQKNTIKEKMFKFLMGLSIRL